MAKAFRILADDLKGVDIVVQMRDARVGYSSINPKFEKDMLKKAQKKQATV